ncbi:MAG TPA: TonB-dependent receptor [Vicinamibacteria bacterium]|nr:TonB-dependent receptor [Vicinamibacteria bacterium]
MFQSLARRLLLAALAVVAAVPVLAQPSTGRLAGTVRDTSGAVVPGATVTVIPQPSGATRSAVSTAEGSFAISDLPPGLYTVSAELLGFRKAIRKDVSVVAGGTASADFTIEALLIEEITVTAMKREEKVANVPFAVTAPSGDVLRARGVEDIEAVAANVAGFSVQNLGPGQSQVAMRGVSSGQIVRDQPGVKEQVGAYLDESVISLSLFTPDLDLFDLSRVEVLRGPQGTLFGSGSLSGTVRYISNQPELGVTKWFGEFGGNNISDGDFGGNAKLGANLPLGGTAALRVAAYYSRLAGYMDAVQPDLSVEKDVNGGYRAGLRAAIKIAPNDSLTITPRLVYQKVAMDGWNRIDVFNILANPYTTKRPAVSLGEREQFTQIEEPFTDEFALADLNISYDFGGATLTAITSYTNRDILVVRDATALTGSITGGSIGLPASVYTLDAPLDDATTAKVWTQELRLSGGKDRLHWVAGGFFGTTKRDYGQNLLVAGFEERSGIPTKGLRAPKDSLFYSELSYKLDQFAAFGEGTFSLSDQFSLTGGLRYYHFKEEKEQIFDGIFGNDNNGTALVSQPGDTKASGMAPRLIGSYKLGKNTTLNAQVSRGFRLGGINDPLNVPLCTPQDLVTFGGRETWEDETAWNYEVGSKSTVFGGRGFLNVAAFYMDIRDLQATVTAGSCSSRVVFNVPKARSQGIEVEFQVAPNRNFDLSISGSYNDSTLRSTLTSTAADGKVSVVSGIEEGERLPSVPKFQVAIATTYQWQVKQNALAYVTGTYQHVGSRYTQVGDQLLGSLDLNSFGANTIGGPLTASTFTYDPELPAYDILNLRVGARKDRWDVALFVNNLTDERALLSLDRERGTRARIGFQTNQPRTLGISTRIKF